jgi:hypothetical protein
LTKLPHLGVTFQGYISGIPNLFSSDFDTAFVFKNKEQAEAFITEFADELHNPQIALPAI